MQLKGDGKHDNSCSRLSWLAGPKVVENNKSFAKALETVDEPLDTMLRIQVRELTMGDYTLSGSYTVIMAVSWPV